MKRSVELLIFDFDGTLVDSKNDIADSVNRALAELGQRELPRETLFGYIGRGVEHLLTRALEGTDYADVGQAVRIFKKHYALHLLDQTVLYPHCRETIEHFHGKKRAVFSNKPEEFIRRILERLDLHRAFSAIVGGDTLRQKKPDPAGILKLTGELGVAASAALMIGDSAIDIETGKRGGVRTCAVTYGYGDRASLAAAGPDYLIDDIAELQSLVG